MTPYVEQVSEVKAKKSVSERVGTVGAWVVVIAMFVYVLWLYCGGYARLPDYAK